MPERRTFDPYAVLGLARDASPLQVARAHRRLAKRYHPDLNPGEDMSERMRRINDAWHLLSNPVRRADFDRRHPAAGTPASGHWAASRRSVSPSAPTSTRSWATWRATAAETRSAPKTVRAPGERPAMPRTRRPEPIEPRERTFLETGWAAVVMAAVLILLLAVAVALGRAQIDASAAGFTAVLVDPRVALRRRNSSPGGAI